MHTIDISPLFRHSVGFERMQRLLDAATRTDSAQGGYPPYNIEQTGEDSYRITMAVAGFSEDDLDITVTDSTLVISGKIEDEGKDVTYLHRGIASRAFERRFDLADHIKVVGAAMSNGLLNVELAREIPEEKKPRKIPVEKTVKQIDQKAA